MKKDIGTILKDIDRTPTEPRKKRIYHFSSTQRAKIAANRAAKRAEKQAKSATDLARKAKAQVKKAKKKRDAANKFVDKVSGISVHGIITGEDLDAATPVAKEVLEETENVIFRPNPGKQESFLAASEKEVLYGGSAGGGKSYGMLADPLRNIDNPNHKAILLRKSMPELQELIDKSQYLYRRAVPGAKWNGKLNRWAFPSGSFILMSFVDNDIDVHRYQGSAFSWIGVDELTHFSTPYVWNYLRSRLRTTDPTLETYMRATTNPGGVGGWWVKKMFIDPAPWNTSFWARDIETDKVLTYPYNEFIDEKLRGKPLFKRRFIPAKLSDNPYLMKSSEYLTMLSSLPEVQRRRLLEGDWDIAEDTAFPEFDIKIHTCKYFDIPADWHRFRSCDYGYVAPACVFWYAVSNEGILYIYRELYAKGLDAEALADKIIEMEWDDPGIITGPLDTESWAERGQTGPSVAETMIRAGVNWTKADKSKGSRIRGKNQIHKRFKPDEYHDGKPGVIIFNNCVNLIRTLPILPLDPLNMEDVDQKFLDDHAYDSFRYGLNSRPTHSLYPDERQYLIQQERPNMVDVKFGY